eukprot:2150848-Lingulodinium_polyedra.AAC.1
MLEGLVRQHARAMSPLQCKGSRLRAPHSVVPRSGGNVGHHLRAPRPQRSPGTTGRASPAPCT